MAKLSEVIGSESLNAADGEGPILAATELFGPVEQVTFAFTQRLDRITLRDLVLSRSYCAVRPLEEQAPILAAVDRIFDEHADEGAIELPYVTACFRTERT